jgi:hypothetical protein
MDVGNFIGELLAQRGNLTVPGLGYFARTRKNGHYNESEGKLYPPSYTVQFIPRQIEDETLVQYIADKKNISLASAEYFTEKFITNLKLQAQSGQIPLADLGWFYTEGSQLFFKPNTHVGDNPEFFGYEPITLQKLGNAPVKEPENSEPAYIPAEIEYTAPVAVPVLVPVNEETADDAYRFETDVEHEQYLESVARNRSRRSTIVFVVLALVFTALAVYLVNRYNPAAFNPAAKKPAVKKTEQVINARVEPIDSTTTVDSAKTSTKSDTASPKQAVAAAKDSIANVTPAPVDSIGFPRWEVMGGTFKTQGAANTAIQNYKTLGVTAHIASDVPGLRFHVSLGTYKTYREAAAATNTLKKDKRISRGIYPLEIKHKK